jgi:hypothetical protein
LVGERFELVKRLGEGGMGVVFEAVDQLSGDRVALKTIQQLDGRSLYRFKQEFRALEDIQHPNLVQLRELHREDEVWFFTMELVGGRDFVAHIRGGPSNVDILDTAQLLITHDSDTYTDYGAPTWDHVGAPSSSGFDEGLLRDSLVQLIEALDVLHRAGRVHRDIKPSNVLVTPAGRVVVLDFGLISEYEGWQFRPEPQEGCSGTVAYMAPEHARGQKATPAGDMYAVGVMLYEILCGRRPFHGSMVKIIYLKSQGDFLPAENAAGSGPIELARLCDALLSPDPKARPVSAEILAQLRGGASHTPAQPLPVGSARQFVGRCDELETLDQAWEAVKQGGAINMLVRGEAGMGKSALLRHFVETRAEVNDDLLLLYGRCYERESVPYKGIDRVVDDLSGYLRELGEEAEGLLVDDVSALARLFPVLWQVPAIDDLRARMTPVRNPREVRRRGFAALKALLRRIGEHRPLLIIIDDLQWADADSWAILREVLAADDAPHMLLLATGRPGAEIEMSTLDTEVHHIELSGLSREELEMLVDTLGDNDGAGWKADALEREAQGHPLLVQQLIQHAPALQTGQRAELEEILWQRIREMPSNTRRLIELVALAGVPLDVDTLATALGAAPADGLQAARHAQTAMLLRIEKRAEETLIEPYHDRVREAAARFMEAADRPLFHARLARALETTGYASSRPHLLVRHLEGAGQTARAAEFAVHAAEQAAEAMAFDRAAELYRDALRMGEHPISERHKLQLALADTLSNAGHGIEAAELYLDSLEALPLDQRQTLRRRAAEEFMTNGAVERGMALVDDLLEAAGVAAMGGTFITVLRIVWHRLILAVFGLRRRNKEPAHPARMRQRIEMCSVLARRLAVIDTLRGFEFQTRELRLALKYGDDNQVATALATEASYRASASTHAGIEAADALLSRARLLAEDLDDPRLDHYLAVQWGIICFFSDRFCVAVDTLSEAIDWFVSESPGDQYIVNSARLFMMFSLRNWGEVARLNELYETLTRDAIRRNDQLVLTSVGASCGIYWLFRDDPEAALRELNEARWIPSQDTVHLQHWFQFIARTQVAIYEGRAKRFLADNHRELRRFFRSPVVWATRATFGEHLWHEGLLYAAAADGNRQVGDKRSEQIGARVRRIVRKLRREDSAMVQLWGSMLEACACALDADADATVDALEAVVAEAHDIDMKLCEVVARRRLGQVLMRRGADGDAARAHALIEQADGWMSAEGIVRPEDIVLLHMPGFVDLLEPA